jgi:CBS domain containing-hemolysin-like protein
MTVWALVAAVLLLLANGFFVAAEFALIASRRTRIEQLAEDGDARARSALSLIRELSFMLSGAQLGITMASLGLGFVAEPAVARLLEGPIHDLGLPAGAAHSVSFVIALTIVVFLHMVIGEMVPKNIAISMPERSALWLAVPMRLYASVFRPVIHLLNRTANGCLRLLGVEPRDELSVAHTAEEIASMLVVSRREGLLEEFEHRLLTGALGFPGRTAASLMVAREQVVAVPVTSTPEDIERLVVESGHSRLPVYGADLDDVLGFVHAKDLLTLPPAARRRPLPLRLVRQMLVVGPGRTVQDLLLLMRSRRLHFALVRDQDRTAGIVTLEDVLEVLVGDIRDEHDRLVAAPPARRRLLPPRPRPGR